MTFFTVPYLASSDTQQFDVDSFSIGTTGWIQTSYQLLYLQQSLGLSSSWHTTFRHSSSTTQLKEDLGMSISHQQHFNQFLAQAPLADAEWPKTWGHAPPTSSYICGACWNTAAESTRKTQKRRPLPIGISLTCIWATDDANDGQGKELLRTIPICLMLCSRPQEIHIPSSVGWHQTDCSEGLGGNELSRTRSTISHIPCRQLSSRRFAYKRTKTTMRQETTEATDSSSSYADPQLCWELH